MSSNISMPPQCYPVKEQIEDCRDYLRTGRCKYGASCKYNHPPNVQSGGGLKVPLNPAEPMFPIRPNEPVCQYFMKHGTCKFGQTCKFHHPPQNSLSGALVSSPVIMAGGRKIDAPQLVLNPVAEFSSGSTMMVQFLPQRDGPDCIYFLKNGRCKYGATCRYNHPINYHQRRVEEPRRSRVSSDPYMQKRISHGGSSSHPPAHVVVAEGPVSFISVDGAQTYKPVAIIPGTEIVAYGNNMGSTVRTEQGSSASSIASSFDTASSGMDQLNGHGDPTGLWSRARKNSSGSSLNAYLVDGGRNQHSRSGIQSRDSEEIPRRTHSNSLGSATEYNSFTEPASRPSSWRQTRSSSFDQSKRPVAGHFINGESSEATESTGRPPMSYVRRHRQPGRSGDEGFTMMTSVLLNMLDTPEETAAEAYSDEGSHRYVGGEQDVASRMEQLSLQDNDNISQSSPTQPDLNRLTLPVSETTLMPETIYPAWMPPDGWNISHQSPQVDSSQRALSSQGRAHIHTPLPNKSHDFGLYIP